MKKKIITLLMSLIMLLLVVQPVPVSAATFTNVKVFYMTRLSDFSEHAGKSFGFDYTINENQMEKNYYYKFTLKQDSIVRIHTAFKSDGALLYYNVNLYRNQSCVSPVHEISSLDYGADEYAQLKKGTYYLKFSLDNRYGGSYKGSVAVSIGAMSLRNAIKVTRSYNPKTKAVTAAIKQCVYEGDDADFGDAVIQYLKKKDTDDGWGHWLCNDSKKISGYQTLKISSNRKMIVTLRTTFADTVKLWYINLSPDTTAPAVSGVKNKGIYKKSVSFVVRDTQSGVRAAVVNGKKITAGKKYTVKRGTYTVRARDKANNLRVVKFTVK